MMHNFWELARGLFMLDYNCLILLTRAPVESVAGVIAEEGVAWHRDVLGSDVTVHLDSAFVFRLRGHEWSIVVDRPSARVPYGSEGYEWEKSLSCRLHAPVIVYGTSDTCCTIGYTLVEDGQIVEDFFAAGGEGDRPASEGSRFTSMRRQVILHQIENKYDFVEQFFVEQDACDPGIDFGYFFDHHPPEVGKSGRVKNSGLWTPHANGAVRVSPAIERVDYLIVSDRGPDPVPSNWYSQAIVDSWHSGLGPAEKRNG